MEEYYEKKKEAGFDYIEEAISEYVDNKLEEIVDNYEEDIIKILEKKGYVVFEASLRFKWGISMYKYIKKLGGISILRRKYFSILDIKILFLIITIVINAYGVKIILNIGED